ncbi:transmembrane protein 222 [Lycorma delicatula]|uniref:transmembrane protein 222 n=1 Tax=Lycorma delicatula TaxID=130591 RepID=UPI003F518BE3
MHPDLYNNTNWIEEDMALHPSIDIKNVKYPFCVVWTPIPLLTWLFPFVGHMGICTSTGIIRDFAGPFYVGEDNMGFGNPVKYWQLDPKKVAGGASIWDQAISEAADVYKTRMHSLFFDNCHSMVALALNKMNYDNKQNWGMIVLAKNSLIYSHYISWGAWFKTYIPFFILVVIACFILGGSYISP